MSYASAILIYSFGLIISKLIGLLMQPFVTSQLGIENYARLDILIVTSSIASIVVTFGLIDGICRFAHDEKYRQDDCLSTAMGLVFWGGGLFTSIALLNGHVIQQLLPGSPPLWALYLTFINLYLNALAAIPLTKLRMQHRPIKFAIAQAVFAITQAIGIIVLIPRFQVTGIFIAAVASQLLQLIILYRDLPNLKLIYSSIFIRYGSSIMLSGVLGFICLGAERWAIAYYLGLEFLTPYAIAMQWAIAASLLLEPFSLWWFPKRFNLLKNEKLLADITILGCQICVLICAIVTMLGPLFLRFWLSTSFSQSANLIGLIAIMVMFKGISTLLNIGCYYQASGQRIVQINLVATGLSIINIFIILPVFGLLGIIWGSIVIQAIKVFAFYYWSQKELPLPYPLYRLFIALMLLACIFASSTLILIQALLLILLIGLIITPFFFTRTSYRSNTA